MLHFSAKVKREWQNQSLWQICQTAGKHIIERGRNEDIGKREKVRGEPF